MSANSDKINRSYRQSDIKRWQNLKFVVGYEIRHTKCSGSDCAICEILAGKYPKAFKWSGWHADCKCTTIALLMDQDEFDNDELNEFNATAQGTKYIPLESRNTIKILPKNFIDWYVREADKMSELNQFPDFVSKNKDLISKSESFYRTK